MSNVSDHVAALASSLIVLLDDIGFKILNEPERTAALYTLLQHSSQDQIRFFAAVLQQMIKPEEPKAAPVVAPSMFPFHREWQYNE